MNHPYLYNEYCKKCYWNRSVSVNVLYDDKWLFCKVIIYCKYPLILQVQWMRFIWMDLFCYLRKGWLIHQKLAQTCQRSICINKIISDLLLWRAWRTVHYVAKIKTTFSLSHLWETRPVPVEGKSLMFGSVRQSSRWLWGPEAVLTLRGLAGRAALRYSWREGGVRRLGDSHPSQTRLLRPGQGGENGL